jgi:hypothetical protein
MGSVSNPCEHLPDIISVFAAMSSKTALLLWSNAPNEMYTMNLERRKFVLRGPLSLLMFNGRLVNMA